MTLHEAIELVLRENGRPMKASEIAFAINSGKLYFKKDNAPVPTSQIHARVNRYPQLFEKNHEGKILLANGMPSSKPRSGQQKLLS